MTPVSIFFCYAREDEHLRKELEKQLKVLKHQQLIDMWYDREINAGAEWEREIDQHLNAAQIILLLISPDFMDSDYCYGTEMKRAMARHEQGETQVIPILLRSVHWKGAPFAKLQLLPDEGRPIVSLGWHSLDEAFFAVAEVIRERVIALHIQQTKKLGDTYAGAGQHDKALVIYEETLQLAPDNTDLTSLKGLALYSLGRYQEALQVFDHLLSIDPGNGQAIKNRKATLLQIERDMAALSALNDAILLNPQKLKPYIDKLNFLLAKTKHYAEILDTFEDAFKLDATVSLSPLVYTEWARRLFEKPNLAFLEIDTTGLKDDDEVIRILLLDRHGKPIFNTFICGDKEVPAEISIITGITDKHLFQAPALTDAWESIRQVFGNHYVISFNLEFDIEMLEAAAERYSLEMYSISGECLMRRAMLYSGSHSYSKLSDLCAYIGRPLPDYPHRTAFHRAKGQIAVLEAILQNKRLEDPYEGPSY